MFGKGKVFEDIDRKDEFHKFLLDEYTNGTVDWIVERCKEYVADLKRTDCPWCTLGFIIEYDMWINNSFCWPVDFS
jgi:hypothetical protein